jgi:hypothetical protein
VGHIYSLGVQIILEIDEFCVPWRNGTDTQKLHYLQDWSNVKGKRCKFIKTFFKNQSKNPSENLFNL